MTVVYVVSLLEIVLELIDRHVLRSILHDLKHFLHVVLMLLLSHEVYMAMRVIEKNKLIALMYVHHHVRLNELQLQLRAALNALCVEVRSIIAFETVGVHLNVYLLFPGFGEKHVSKVVLIGDVLE